jgi:uncharacterized membrane protein YgdD (TMEM256/DUF423 family)
VLAALLAAVGVMAGAFGAHALRDIVDPADLAIWETASRYHLLHAVALLAIGLQSPESRIALHKPAIVLLVGTLIFSGSLYALVLSGIRGLGAVTPLGGVALIVGWVWLAWQLWQQSGDR